LVDQHAAGHSPPRWQFHLRPQQHANRRLYGRIVTASQPVGLEAFPLPDQLLIRTLRSNRDALPANLLAATLVARGVALPTARRAIEKSLVLECVGRRVYALRGSFTRDEPVVAPGPPWIRTGKNSSQVWIAWRLAADTSRSGRLRLPGRFARKLPRSFTVHGDQGKPIGAVERDGNVLGGFNRLVARLGGQAGDVLCMRYAWRPQARASVALGDAELVDRFGYASGEHEPPTDFPRIEARLRKAIGEVGLRRTRDIFEEMDAARKGR
jgi:hypothetical protein